MCTCEKKKSGKGKGKVQGYVVTKLCPECIAQRAVDAIAEVENKKEQDANQMVAERMYSDAKDKLLAEGKIEKVDGKLSKK